jgi:hypothetical protein
MTTITVHTEDKEQINALKAVLKALKIKFKMSKEDTKTYNPEFTTKIKESKKQHDKGDFTTVKKEDLKKFLGLE